MTIWLLCLPLLALIVGIVLLTRGLRGRRIDDHPICRKCGFDLFNRPETSHACAECGADLRRPRAIQDGRRERRRGLVIVGGLLIALVVGLGGTGAYFTVSSSNWRQYAPIWWLRYEAGSVDPTSRDAAIAELSARLTAGTLSQAQIDALADKALAFQADKTNTWVPAWGNLVESAQAANKLSAARFGTYLEQALNLRLEVRADITRGDRLYYWIREGPARIAQRSTYYVNYANSWDIGTLRHRNDGGSSGTSMNANGGGGTGTAVYFKPEETKQLHDGANEIVMHLDISFGKSWNTTGSPLHKSKVDLRGTFTVHAAGESTVKLVHDPSLRAAVERGVKCQELNYRQSWGPNMLGINMQVGKTPVGVAYDVFTTINGKEIKLGSFARAKATSDYGYGFGTDVPAFEDTTLDLVLKPSVDAAIGTTDTFEMWDGEIVLKNVPVRRPASQPATTTATTQPARAKT